MAVQTATNPYLSAQSQAGLLTTEKCLEQPTCAIISGATSLFTVAGGPVLAQIYGVVTTVLGGASNGTLQITTTTPSATVALSTTVAIDTQAAGSSIRFVGATGVLTPATAGSVIIDPVTVGDCWFLLTIGTVKFLTTAARTGNIKFYLRYIPLSADSVVALV